MEGFYLPNVGSRTLVFLPMPVQIEPRFFSFLRGPHLTFPKKGLLWISMKLCYSQQGRGWGCVTSVYAFSTLYYLHGFVIISHRYVLSCEFLSLQHILRGRPMAITCWLTDWPVDWLTVNPGFWGHKDIFPMICGAVIEKKLGVTCASTKW